MEPVIFIVLLAVGCDVALGRTKEYIYISSPLGWNDAQLYCRNNYKDLATITSNDENSNLFKSGSAIGRWIGLKRTSNIWEWSDGEQFSHSNWYEGKPYYADAGYDCGATSSQIPDVWVNYDCNDIRSFFCYRFLILVKEKKTWEEAQEFCRINYTGLASAASELSLNLLKLEAVGTETENVWTGLRFMNGQWFWVSGEPLGSLVSMPSCPVQYYHCGALNTTTNTVKNHNCNNKLNFICYWH